MTEEHEVIKPIVEESQSQIITTRRLQWAIVVLVGLLFLVIVALQFQVTQRNRDISDIQAATDRMEVIVTETARSSVETKKAAEEAKEALLTALAQAQSARGQAVPAEEIRAALEAIHRIEARLGG